jgi:voltage-gated potassium channel Kch
MKAVDADLLVAIVTLSLALTPAVFALVRRLASRKPPTMPEAHFSGTQCNVLLIGFGRFGQTVAQLLLARGLEVTAIDRDVEAIQAATRFGFHVYYGDGTRLDVLRSAGAEQADLIAVCIDHKRATLKIVEICKEHFPDAKLYVRANDRRHALELASMDVDYQIREIFNSAVAFGVAALKEVGTSNQLADDIEADMRRRDTERFERQRGEGFHSGRHLMHTRPAVQPEPLREPNREGRIINENKGADEEHEDEIRPS